MANKNKDKINNSSNSLVFGWWPPTKIERLWNLSLRSRRHEEVVLSTKIFTALYVLSSPFEFRLTELKAFPTQLSYFTARKEKKKAAWARLRLEQEHFKWKLLKMREQSEKPTLPVVGLFNKQPSTFVLLYEFTNQAKCSCCLDPSLVNGQLGTYVPSLLISISTDRLKDYRSWIFTIEGL